MYGALPNLNPVDGTMKIHEANLVVDGEVKISMKDRSSDNKSWPIKLSVNFNRPKQQVKKAKKSSPAPVDSESDDNDSSQILTRTAMIHQEYSESIVLDFTTKFSYRLEI